MTTKIVKDVGTLVYDQALTVSCCKDFHSDLARVETTVQKLYECFSRFKITDETYLTYSKLDKGEKLKCKDVGGMIAGSLVDYDARSGGSTASTNRFDANVKDRCAVMLDFDECGEANPFDAYRAEFNMSACMYSTHSSTDFEKRVRLFVPLTRTVDKDEYQAVARYIAGKVGIDMVDDCSFKWCQLMFLPSAPLDVSPIFDFIDAPICDPDDILERYDGSWKDRSKWAQTKKERERNASEPSKAERKDRQLNPGQQTAQFPEPLELTAEHGAFNKVYFPIQEAIKTFLSDIYKPTNNRKIYTLIKGEGANGLKIVDDEMKAYSFHSNHDPAADGQKKDAYELVMIQLFGKGADAVQKMNELVRQDERCKEYLKLEDEARSRLEGLYRIDLTQNYPDPESAVTINGIPVITLGNLQSVKAKAKNGKTMFLSIIMAALLKGECLGIERLTDEGTRVLFFDNEQHINTAAKVVKRVHQLCGISIQENSEQFTAFCLTPMDVEKRIDFICDKIRQFAPQVAFVDGIADLIWDFNDLVTSEKCVDRLYKVAQECNTAVVCVLHENKADNNMRGHLGTVLLKAGTDTFEVKRIDKSQNFIVTHTETRFKPVGDYYFSVGDDGTPCASDAAPVSKQQKQKDDIYSNIQLVFKGMSQLRYTDLCTEYQEVAGCSERTAKLHIANSLKWGFLSRDSGYYSRS